MKKILTVYLAVGVFVLNATAQTKSDNLVKFGVSGGINISNFAISPSQSPKPNSLTGLNAGAFVVVPLSNSFSFQPELLFSGLGAKQSSTNMGISYTDKVLLNYIDVPALVKYSISNTGVAVYAGPQIGFLLSAKDNLNGNSTDIKSSFTSADFDGVLGLGYALPVGLSVSARYQLGLTAINKNSSASGEKIKNTAFSITISYTFGKK